LAAALQDSNGLLWVDFQAEPPEVCEPILHETFGFHPLAVDDALQESHVPKLDDWGQYLYLVLHAVVFDERDSAHVDTLELDVFLGKTYLVTHHDQPIVAVDHVWDLCQRDERYTRKGVDRLLYRLADELVDSHMPVVERMDEAIDRFED
jgi:magnesium transporter